ncbi:MAG TPA: mechanosensitive ion channel family protein [Gemmatimonadales bacterium]|nr:mechanosensitive ion channel family protein [Gemmatimonadales bacterium]
MTSQADILELQFAGNPVSAWLMALLAFAVAFGIILVVRRLLQDRVMPRVEATKTGVDDMLVELVHRTRYFFAALLGVVVATRFLHFSDRVERLLYMAFVLLLLVQIANWGNALLDAWLRRFTREKLPADAASVTTVRAAVLVLKLVMAVILFLVALQTVGVNVTALVAGLGIGGIAVALAVQSVLGDLIASFSIVLDKPFVVGDSIAVDKVSGTVEEVGLRSTRIRSLSGEQVIMSNTDLARSRIYNYKRMAERRIAFTIGVEYGTPSASLREIPAMIRQVITETPNTRFDRSHFATMGEQSLLIESVYYVMSPEYSLYMDIQQHLNMEIIRRLEDMQVRIAIPGRTVVFLNDGSRESVASGAEGLAG